MSLFEHVHLQSLALAVVPLFLEDCSMGIILILNCLKAPQLESLTLEFADDCLFWGDISPFLSFLSRSSAQLHTLALSAMPTTADDPIECLKAAPSLVHLKLHLSYCIRNATPIFILLTGQSDFLPNLQSSQFSLSRTEVKPDAAIEMLRWRWASVRITGLQSFRLTHPDPVPPYAEDIKSHPEFRRLKQDGMILHIGRMRLNAPSPGEAFQFGGLYHFYDCP
ncbi:hypothetical protein B0H19DRAFT_1273397 [Mycena capillaripes]|nr:hypothetical protein B0H19DRAFT_1273397 [Mycena capillaripes]